MFRPVAIGRYSDAATRISLAVLGQARKAINKRLRLTIPDHTLRTVLSRAYLARLLHGAVSWNLVWVDISTRLSSLTSLGSE